MRQRHLRAPSEPSISMATFTTGRWCCRISEAQGRCIRLEFQDPGNGEDVTGWYRVETEPLVQIGHSAARPPRKGRAFTAAAGTWYDPKQRQGGILLRGVADNGEPLSLKIPATGSQEDLFHAGVYAVGQTHVGCDEQGRNFALTLVARPEQPQSRQAA